MAMDEFIRISKWTKELLDEFKDVENHSSYDSVIKSLIPRALFEEGMVFDKDKGLLNMTKDYYIEIQHEEMTENWKDLLKRHIRGE